MAALQQRYRRLAHARHAREVALAPVASPSERPNGESDSTVIHTLSIQDDALLAMMAELFQLAG
jgi:hypothetical protein